MLGQRFFLASLWLISLIYFSAFFPTTSPAQKFRSTWLNYKAIKTVESHQYSEAASLLERAIKLEHDAPLDFDVSC
jgi:hypothetical protein